MSTRPKIDDPHYSVSQLNRYNFCGESYRLKYAEKKDEPGTTHQIRGSALHNVAEVGCSEKMNTGEIMTVEQAEDLAAKNVDLAFQEEVTFSEEEAEAGINVVKGQTKDTAVDLSRYHVKKILPVINPASVEEDVRVKFDGLPTMVHRIDLTDTEGVVTDWKTAKAKPNEMAVSKMIQATGYHVAYQVRHKKPPTAVNMHYLVRTRGGKTTAPKTADYPIVMHKTQEEIQSYIRRLYNMHEGIQKGVFIPINPEHFLCSPTYCGYFGQCQFTRGMRRK